MRSATDEDEEGVRVLGLSNLGVFEVKEGRFNGVRAGIEGIKGVDFEIRVFERSLVRAGRGGEWERRRAIGVSKWRE